MWKCRRCGECCFTYPDRTEWKKAKLKKTSEGYLLRERSRYKALEGCCEMLCPTEDGYICLIHKAFGHESKPEACREFGENLCLKTTK